jgi:hypothetical protein
MKEIWKEIIGFENYQISNFGNVIGKEVKTSFGCGYKIYPNRNVKQWKCKKGYCYVTLLNLKLKKNLSIHRLVALHFIENTENKPQVNHKDGNKQNNHISNLEWATAKENLLHAMENNLNNISGVNNYLSKLTWEDVFEIRKSTLTQRELGIKYNICQSCISRVKLNKSYKINGK